MEYLLNSIYPEVRLAIKFTIGTRCYEFMKFLFLVITSWKLIDFWLEWNPKRTSFHLYHLEVKTVLKLFSCILKVTSSFFIPVKVTDAAVVYLVWLDFASPVNKSNYIYFFYMSTSCFTYIYSDFQPSSYRIVYKNKTDKLTRKIKFI